MFALSTSLVLPTIATPSIAEGTANSYSRPDLATRFEDLYARYKQQWERDEKEREDFEAAVFARTGIALESDGSGTEEYNQIRGDIAKETVWNDPDLENWSALSAETAELARLILNEPVATIADMILQARVCALENNNLWKDTPSIEAMDLGQRSCRLLVESICQFGGLAPLPGLSVFPMTPSIAHTRDAELLAGCRNLEEAARIESDLAKTADALDEKDAEYLPAHRRRLDAYVSALDLFDAIENVPPRQSQGSRRRRVRWNGIASIFS
jgi:hypothetical protein